MLICKEYVASERSQIEYKEYTLCQIRPMEIRRIHDAIANYLCLLQTYQYTSLESTTYDDMRQLVRL